MRATFFALPAFLTAFAGAAFAGGVGAAPNLRAPEITSFKPFAGKKRTFLLALIWIDSPVNGLRPLRAGRSTFLNLPKSLSLHHHP